MHNYYRDRGGEDEYVDSLAQLLKKEGHTIIRYTKHSSSINQNFFKKITIALGLLYSKKTATELTAIIRTHKPDIAHFHNVFPLITPTAYYICEKERVPIAQTVHNYRYMCVNGTLFHRGQICTDCLRSRNLLSCVYDACYQNSRFATLFFALVLTLHRKHILNTISRIIFPTSFSQTVYSAYFKNLKSKSEVIYHGVSIPKIMSKKTRTVEKPYFLYVGRLSPEKGIIELINALTTKPTINLVVAGTGPLSPMLKKYRQHTNIQYKGYCTRKTTLRLIAHAQAVVIPSLWYEVLPLVYIESLALNTPVITPNTGTFSFFQGKSRDHTYSFGNIADLVRKMEAFTRTSDISYTRNIYENYFTPARHSAKLIECYDKLISKYT